MRDDYKSVVNLVGRRQIAEERLGRIRWVSETVGYCDCPGAAFHSSKAGRRDCRVILDGPPTIHCLHMSCASVMKEANHGLRSAVGKAETVKATARDNINRRAASTPAEARRRQLFRIVRVEEAFAHVAGGSVRTLSDVSESFSRIRVRVQPP